MLLLSIGLALFPFAFLDKILTRKVKLLIIFLFCNYFVFLGGFRWLTGTDWYSYYYAFINADTYYGAVQAPHTMEWGYGMLNYIVNVLGGSYTVFLLIFTFLKIYLKYKVFISRYFFKYALLSFFLFYCYEVGAIYGTRQTLAVSILFLSIIPIIRKKLFIFLVLLIIAVLIHRTAIVFIFSYWLFHYKSTQKQLLLIFINSILLYLVFLNVDPSFLTKLPLMSNLIAYQQKIEAYSQLKQISYGKIDSTISNLFGILKKMTVLLPLLFSVNYLKKRLPEDEFKIYRGLLNLIVYGSILYFVFGAMASDFKKMNSYFEIFEVLAIPILLYNIRNKKMFLLYGMFFIIIAFSKLYATVTAFEDLLDPFYFIFDLPFNRYMY